jgi:hypothetical protein
MNKGKLNTMPLKKIEQTTNLPPILPRRQSMAIQESRRNSDFFDSSRLFVSERVRFQMKYLKEEISSGNKAKKIRDQVTSLLSANKGEEMEKDKDKQEQMAHMNRRVSDAKLDIKLFREYLQHAKNDSKCHMRNKHPFFIISSRLHSDDMLNNPVLLNSVFTQNVEKFVRLNEC